MLCLSKIDTRSHEHGQLDDSTHILHNTRPHEHGQFDDSTHTYSAQHQATWARSVWWFHKHIFCTTPQGRCALNFIIWSFWRKQYWYELVRNDDRPRSWRCKIYFRVWQIKHPPYTCPMGKKFSTISCVGQVEIWGLKKYWLFRQVPDWTYGEDFLLLAYQTYKLYSSGSLLRHQLDLVLFLSPYQGVRDTCKVVIKRD